MSVIPRTTPFRSRRTIAASVAMIAASALVMTGCTSGTAETPSPKPAVGVQDLARHVMPGKRNLTVKIGTLLPETGDLAFLGMAQKAGAALAVADVNGAGLGIAIENVDRDSGAVAPADVFRLVADLLSEKVSAIVGGTSTAAPVTDAIVSAGVVQILPAAPSAEITPGTRDGLFWSTAPSPAKEGRVLAKQIAKDGNRTLGLVVANNAFGTGLADSITTAFEAVGGRVVATVLFNDGDVASTTPITTVLAANPDAIALVTLNQAKSIVPALVGTGYPGDRLYFVDRKLEDSIAAFPPGLITGAKGVLPGADQSVLGAFQKRLSALDPNLSEFASAAETYDAVMLIAVAAYAANDSSSRSIADYLRQVSGGTGGGTRVMGIATAAETLATGQQVDYDGYSGPISFDDNGNASDAVVGIYQVGADEKYSHIN
jgi:ABC-type branched-subunit amino acid transport system substrate-binding protein